MSNKFFSSSTPKFDVNPIEKAYADGYEAAASDPKTWYVLDKNGEKVHIGDTVYAGNMSENGKVIGFVHEENNNTYCVLRMAKIGIVEPRYCETKFCEKVHPDTREKIIDDISKSIYSNFAGGQCYAKEKAEKFVARVEALHGDV